MFKMRPESGGGQSFGTAPVTARICGRSCFLRLSTPGSIKSPSARFRYGRFRIIAGEPAIRSSELPRTGIGHHETDEIEFLLRHDPLHLLAELGLAPVQELEIVLLHLRKSEAIGIFHVRLAVGVDDLRRRLDRQRRVDAHEALHQIPGGCSGNLFQPCGGIPVQQSRGRRLEEQ